MPRAGARADHRRRSTPTAATAACSGRCSTSRRDAGRDAFLRLAETCRRASSRASAPAWPTSSASATPTCAPATRASSTARPPASARPARESRGPATTSTTSPRRLPRLHRPSPRRTAGAAGRHRRRHRRRRHAGGDGDHGRAAAPRAHRARASYLDVSIADGALAMMSLYVDEYLATGAEPGPGHYILTGRYACYDVYACADGRFVAVGAIEPQFCATSAGCSASTSYADAQTRRRTCRTRSAPPSPPCSLTRAATSGWPSSARPTPAWPRSTPSPRRWTTSSIVARGAIVDAVHAAEHGAVPPGRADLGRHRRARRCRIEVRDGTVTDTAALLADAGYDATRRSMR